MPSVKSFIFFVYLSASVLQYLRSIKTLVELVTWKGLSFSMYPFMFLKFSIFPKNIFFTATNRASLQHFS